ncbi:hypothetical protein PIB30_036549 [Stylosanthes scabra]|uniref:Protein-S-isoprenylcysteine O-methyltransferase n=1 Tax=Stylosanthes scabra TaxID=79078 RepID=A0ABU6UD95_9FABA|nr:hypothetical protein [Stylosanthes scabra]
MATLTTLSSSSFTLAVARFALLPLLLLLLDGATMTTTQETKACESELLASELGEVVPAVMLSQTLQSHHCCSVASGPYPPSVAADASALKSVPLCPLSGTAKEILSYTACRQLSQMFLATLFFHTSEYTLLMAIHGRSNETPSSGTPYRIRIHQQDDHHLITHGIYRFMRHPGYTGYLIWYVGAQIMLCNPISAVAFAVVVWHAFARRIAYEEDFLRRFLERDYEEYARKVGSGIPFIN